MRSDLDKSDFFRNVTETGNASEIQIAALCCILFGKAGMQSYPVISGNRNFFALDTSFLFWSDWLTTPLPVLVLNGKPLVAYPFARGYELGEYPPGYSGMTCLDLREKKCRPLPAPIRGGKSTVRKRRVLAIGGENGVHRLFLEFRENDAAYYRNKLLAKNKEEQKSYFEEFIKNYSGSNRLVSFSINDLTVYETPLTAQVSFSAETRPIEHEKRRIVKLDVFFSDYFRDITPDRTDDVFMHHPATIIDEVEVLKIPGKTVSIDMRTEPITNDLFAARYETSETDSSIGYSRTLVYPRVKTRFSMAEIRKGIYDDIVRLNGIKNATVSIE